MRLKKFTTTALIAFCISASMPSFSATIIHRSDANVVSAGDPKTVDPLVRLKEIKDMDKSNLSRAEKKSLRKELKKMKKEGKKNGIYLSVGAIIVIILLLILLL